MILESIFTGAIFAFEIPTGTIADKFGRKLSLNIAFIVNAFAVIVYVSYPNFYSDIEIGTHILIDDGEIDLEVTNKKEGSLICYIKNEIALY
mgnify:CR=1 FL=1